MGLALREVRRPTGTGLLNQPLSESGILFGPARLRLPDVVYAYGFSLNKRASLRRFAAESAVCFVGSAERIPLGSTVLLWGSHALPQDLRRNVDVVRVEDGFLRSVGLGAEFAQPLSWVMDGRGIHYDATQPSDLEHLLQTQRCPQALLERAASLRERLVASGITKYSVGYAAWERPRGSTHVILVPGQVESDASLRFGAPGLNTNLGLLQAARLAHPESYLVYKPHPDVVARLRARGAGEAQAKRFCDEVVTDVAMGEFLKQVDEVHVLTSLTGFEALLRRKTVVCYGLPFYAGWGLTKDILTIARRTRRLTLDELVAVSLTCYPGYVSRLDGRSSTPERALDDLMAWRASHLGRSHKRRNLWRRAIRLTVGAA
jgi:capsular polysaccharide export protein